MPYICTESCRISHPPDIAGDYHRGVEYDDPRLASLYPSLFKAIVSPSLPSEEIPEIAEEETLSVRPAKKAKAASD